MAKRKLHGTQKSIDRLKWKVGGPTMQMVWLDNIGGSAFGFIRPTATLSYFEARS